MKNVSKPIFLRIIICVAVLVVVLGVGFLTGIFDNTTFGNITVNFRTILRLVIMVAAVIAIESLIVVILGAIKTENHRLRSILSIVSSLLKYVAGIVILGILDI